MRSFSPNSLGAARARSEKMMSRIARALVEAETTGPVDLDPAAALRFLDSLEELADIVPYAARRLAARLVEHGSPAVRRAAAGAARLCARGAPDQAEAMLAHLCGDAQAPVRTAAARALTGLIAVSADPLALVNRWLGGTPGQREAMERARRRLPAPIGTGPVARARPTAAPEASASASPPPLPPPLPRPELRLPEPEPPSP